MAENVNSGTDTAFDVVKQNLEDVLNRTMARNVKAGERGILCFDSCKIKGNVLYDGSTRQDSSSFGICMQKRPRRWTFWAGRAARSHALVAQVGFALKKILAYKLT